MRLAEEIQLLAPWTKTLPSDWQVTRLDDVADVLFSNVDKHTKDDEIPVKLCNYVDVYKNDSITSEIDFMEATAQQREINTFQIKRGDLLATKDSETPDDIAITALVEEDLPGTLCGYHLALIRPRLSSICGPFLSWLHSSKPFRSQYEAKAVGVTRYGLSQYSFRAARVPLLPISEQRRIADYLDASCKAIDAAIQAKQKQILTLGIVRESLIESAVTVGTDRNIQMRDVNADWIVKIPSHWDVCRIKRIVSRVDYGISASTQPEGQHPVLKMGHIQNGEIGVCSFNCVNGFNDS